MNTANIFLGDATDKQIADECNRRLKLAVEEAARAKSTPLTRAEALRSPSTLYHRTARNADGTALRARSNGKCTIWKTRPDEFRLPVKHGLKHTFYITEWNQHEWSLVEPKYVASTQRTAAV